MGEIFFVFKSLLLTTLIVVALKVDWGGKTLENRLSDWVGVSQAANIAQIVADDIYSWWNEKPNERSTQQANLTWRPLSMSKIKDHAQEASKHWQKTKQKLHKRVSRYIDPEQAALEE